MLERWGGCIFGACIKKLFLVVLCVVGFLAGKRGVVAPRFVKGEAPVVAGARLEPPHRITALLPSLRAWGRQCGVSGGGCGSLSSLVSFLSQDSPGRVGGKGWHLARGGSYEAHRASWVRPAAAGKGGFGRRGGPGRAAAPVPALWVPANGWGSAGRQQETHAELSPGFLRPPQLSHRLRL